jgi:hypothetical protein
VKKIERVARAAFTDLRMIRKMGKVTLKLRGLRLKAAGFHYGIPGVKA